MLVGLPDLTDNLGFSKARAERGQTLATGWLNKELEAVTSRALPPHAKPVIEIAQIFRMNQELLAPTQKQKMKLSERSQRPRPLHIRILVRVSQLRIQNLSLSSSSGTVNEPQHLLRSISPEGWRAKFTNLGLRHAYLHVRKRFGLVAGSPRERV